MSNSFFQEQKEQSLVKARIVEKYFWAWAKVIISKEKKSSENPKIAYIDLFAGPGRYEDGSTSTPIKVLEQAIADPEISQMLVTLFNDVDSASVSSLKSSIQNLPGIEKLKFSPAIRNEEVGTNIVKIFEEKRLIPTLFFVDPWGYKGLSLKLINSVIKNPGCDCIFFFNYNRINMGLTNQAVKEHLDSLFGEQRANIIRQKLDEENLSPLERETTIIEAICEALQEMGGQYVLPFRFKNESGSRTSHHLIFVSKSIIGYKIMKEIMAKESSEIKQGVPSFEYSPASQKYPLLFELSRPLDDLEEMLLNDFAGQTLTMQEIFEKHNIGKSYISKNYKDALISLEIKKKIEAYPPLSSRRKGTFSDSVRVTFPSKQ